MEEWRQWCIQAEIERDEARAMVVSICKPLHVFVLTCGKFDGVDAGFPIVQTEMKYANEYRDDSFDPCSRTNWIVGPLQRSA